MFEGHRHHEDSVGHRGDPGPGDVQRMPHERGDAEVSVRTVRSGHHRLRQAGISDRAGPSPDRHTGDIIP
ncbi:hypothetical protein [Methylococcus capsulatus]|uniref:hypothetical protein n=1 Tax=Methylococcus capsulatus TaxID=414 RepID=UPI0012B65E5F|nr:hypothetical protein KW114_05195 [Methylococcus capsulatus]